jgi:hypothetical protein
MQPRLTRTQVIRAQHLLNMRYAPSELADEIGCKADTVYRSFIPSGCPHERDEGGRLWIMGAQFREWARATGGGDRTREKMPAGVAYCFHCRKRVKMLKTTVKPTNCYLELVRGECAECGGVVNRAQKKGKEETCNSMASTQIG